MMATAFLTAQIVGGVLSLVQARQLLGYALVDRRTLAPLGALTAIGLIVLTTGALPDADTPLVARAVSVGIAGIVGGMIWLAISRGGPNR